MISKAEEDIGLCWVKEITKGQGAVRLEMKLAMDQRGQGDTALEAKLRHELDAFRRFGEQRLSSPLLTVNV